MERKPQQQTLSIRISDTLRDFLEESRGLMADARNEPVSVSDVAKLLLESVRDDRFDFRLEVAELLQAPTVSLVRIRRKWERRISLARAEWILLAKYIEIACEEITESPLVPNQNSLALLLEAFLAVRGLRTEGSFGLDRYYLGNLGVPDVIQFNERQYDPQVVPRVVGRLLEELRQSPGLPVLTFAARNLFVALRDEVLVDVVALNTVLEPLLVRLFRLAARGHWIREHRPARVPNAARVCLLHIPSVAFDGIALSVSSNAEDELLLDLIMESRGIVYAVGSYPQIREFAALVDRLDPGRVWNGLYLHWSADWHPPDEPCRFHFLRRADEIRLAFNAEEWGILRRLVAVVLALPSRQPILEELTLTYGEL